MGVACQILINSPQGGVHKAGTPVTGVVKFAIDEPTEFKDVTLSLLGKGKCRWPKHALSSYHNSEDYMAHHINITNKRRDEKITLHGAYEFPFKFYLPEDIPTSFRDVIGYIIYNVQLKFVKPNFLSSDKVFTTEIPVIGAVNLTRAESVSTADVPVIFGIEKPLFAPFATNNPTVNLKAEINKTCLSPGENAHLSYVVTNNTDVKITSVRTELVCNVTYTAECGHVAKEHTKVRGCKVETPGVREREVGNFTCVLPTLPDLYSIQNSSIISREYRVRTTCRLPAPHSNVSVEMPVVIGERKGSMEPTVYTLDSAGPPSYGETMCQSDRKQCMKGEKNKD